MRTKTAAAVALLASLLPWPAMAGTACPAMFEAGAPPDLVAANLRQGARELCYSRFAVVHSALTRTPLWSAEHLTADAVRAASAREREDTFHPDPNLPPGEGADLADYKRSGYDRGHMSPNGDMPDPASADESFSLANMVPQDPDNNRHLWAAIESAVRDLTVRYGEAYVVTGPAFQGDRVASLKGRVLVPTSIWKAVYVPALRGGAAYVTPNAPGEAFQVVSLDQQKAMTGIDAFPALSAAAKATAIQLPAPSVRRRAGEDRPYATHAPSTGGVLGGIYRALKKEW